METRRCKSIDAVFTWVDGNDQQHKRKRDFFSSVNHVDRQPESNAVTRFASVGELWYATRLLRLNAPWIRTIYLITDEQRPEWLTEAVADDLGILMVDHRELFRGYEDYLPTFSSRTIEAMLWRISTLSERFLYLNDDFFVIRPVQPSDYFCDSRPIIRGRWTWTNRILSFVERRASLSFLRDNTWNGLVGLRPECKLLGYKRYFRLAHAPYSLIKSELAKCFSDDILLRKTIQFRFRSDNQIWPVGYYGNKVLRADYGLVGPCDWSYLSPLQLRGKLTKDLNIKTHLGKSKHLCIQSMDQLDDQIRNACMEFLSESLKSPW